MSYTYSTKYGKGYLISWDEIAELNEEIREQLISSNYTYQICGCSDTLPIFFGIVKFELDDYESGYYMISADEIDFDKNEVDKMTEELKRLMPNREHYVPRRFILGCCE